MSNIFVLCTGRCGSETFAKAGKHLTNYTSGHETRSQIVGEGRLSYPRNHIEADNRLSWFLGGLESRYGQDAFYVHLKRDQESVAQSYNRRWGYGGSMMRAFKDGIHLSPGKHPSIEWCRHYVSTVTENIEYFLSDKPKVMEIHLETVQESFPQFLDRIDAEGNLSAALAEWSVRHNAAKPPSLYNRLRQRAGRVYHAVFQ